MLTDGTEVEVGVLGLTEGILWVYLRCSGELQFYQVGVVIDAGDGRFDTIRWTYPIAYAAWQGQHGQ